MGGGTRRASCLYAFANGAVVWGIVTQLHGLWPSTEALCGRATGKTVFTAFLLLCVLFDSHRNSCDRQSNVVRITDYAVNPAVTSCLYNPFIFLCIWIWFLISQFFQKLLFLSQYFLCAVIWFISLFLLWETDGQIAMAGQLISSDTYHCSTLRLSSLMRARYCEMVHKFWFC